jgi:hypothetical protein
LIKQHCHDVRKLVMNSGAIGVTLCPKSRDQVAMF